MSKDAFGKRAATSAGRQPGGLSHTRSLSAQLRACHESLASAQYTSALAHSGSQLRSSPRVPYTQRSSSSRKVPNMRSHTIRMPP
jgi:hypothetical protein